MLPGPPRRVWLLGQLFQVTVAEELPRWAADKAVGAMLLKEQTIALRTGLAPDQERDTVLHEVLHAILRLLDVPLTDRQEELVVAGLSPVLLDVLRRNPDLVEYLTTFELPGERRLQEGTIDG